MKNYELIENGIVGLIFAIIEVEVEALGIPIMNEDEWVAWAIWRFIV